MLLSKFKNHLSHLNELTFVLPDSSLVPAHFHITEAGLVSKHVIDCGGTVKKTQSIIFQIWVAGDTDHRLKPSKLLEIIKKADEIFGDSDPEVEFEYQSGTIGRFGVAFTNDQFNLLNLFTDCPAKDKCGIPAEKQKLKLSDLTPKTTCCSPNEVCC
ncbi:MAG: hypothetical protein GC181_09390 [Bacteroidetes bacterium]|nr:hypothetical protein [Bacteroidota bacterium]